MARQLSIGHFSIVDFSLDEISGERAHFVRDAEHHRVDWRGLADVFARDHRGIVVRGGGADGL